MARSSQERRRATAWTAAQNQPSMPRIVRLGRPANDNFRLLGAHLRLYASVAAALVLLLAAAAWYLG